MDDDVKEDASEWVASEDDLVPISALEHYSYCPRQWALIHREQTFDENIYTLRGNAAHERVNEELLAYEDGVRVERGLPLWCRRLGLVGRADVVEFHGLTPYPVEYKLGKHSGRHGELQLCAQAMALEEMTGQKVPRGAVYVVSTRQRRQVAFTPQLREMVAQTLAAIRAAMREPTMPPAVADRRCPNCSLVESCLPNVVAKPRRTAAAYSRLFVPEGIT